jgi:two-component system, NtrC family, sensor kinase
MQSAPKPQNEKERLEALQRYQILDTQAEKDLDDLTQLAAAICGTPIALISLIDHNRQWFKSKVGVDASETPRDVAFCAHGILQKDVFIVPDAAQDQRFHDNPLVTEGPQIRFYAGVPLITSDGYPLGMLCVNDRVPRQLTEEQTRALRILGNQVISMLELRRTMTNLVKAQASIIQAEKMSAVGNLAAGIAHEINNPLGVILGFSQALMRKLPAQSEWREPITAIEREAVRCKGLVQELLIFSRTSEHAQEPLELNPAIESALALVQPRAKVAQVKVIRSFDHELPSISGNSQQIQQVVINLANNAIDAMPEGGTLTVKTEHSTDQEREWVFLKIEDTGSGIPKEVQARIFEPFFTTKPKGQGTGLGLGLVHEIIDKHGGSIHVQSQPGHTEFLVKFPLSKAA